MIPSVEMLHIYVDLALKKIDEVGIFTRKFHTILQLKAISLLEDNKLLMGGSDADRRIDNRKNKRKSKNEEN